MKTLLKEYTLAVAGFKFSELTLISAGNQVCEPEYKCGGVRNCYIIHYVISGQGKLFFDGKEYSIKAGQAFLIEPGYVVSYQADKADPWEYVWLNFDGEYVKGLLETAGLSQFNPVFPSAFSNKLNNIFIGLRTFIRDDSVDEMYVLGSLLQIFSCIVDLPSHIQKLYPKRTIYIKRALDYINSNFHLAISVEEIAKLLRLDRKYFCAIFKEETGVSPIQYILSLKVSRASALLINTDCSVSEVAYSVGYDDLFTFSRMFRQQTGLSPSKFRQTANVPFEPIKVKI